MSPSKTYRPKESKIQTYTIIPDIHADFDRLNASLQLADRNGHILFLGDFIDAGKSVANPADLDVLLTVRMLVDDGKASAVMGNHELNAILYHSTPPLRKHGGKNANQHRSFIDAFGVATYPALKWTDWFLNALPLWKDLDGLRLVHACWSQPQMTEIKKRRPDGFLRREDLQEVSDESTPFGRAVKALLTGPEVKLPEPFVFHDFHGTPRKEVRLAWWRADAATWPEATLSVPDVSQLPQGKLPADAMAEIYQADAPPVLVGHYKMKGEPSIDHPNASSIDYPDAPCIYRWSGENRLTKENLIKL